MSQQTLQNKVLFRRTLKSVWIGLFVVLLAFASLAFVAIAPKAQAATSSTINFQARLLQSNGSLVADGFYNVQFKLYTEASGGTAVWTETYYDSNGVTVGNDNRARVVNGYLSVNLGSQTAFGSSINWDQEHWITMNVGGTTQTATPTWDGEMDPRLKLTGVPYAFTAGQLNKTTGGLTSVLGWANQTAANSILLPDDSGTICLQNDASCGFMTGSAGDYIQNGTTPQTADLNITGSATVGSLLTSTVDTAAAGTLTIGGTNATAITIADDTTISAGLSLTITGGATGTRPASPTEGMMYFDTTTDQLLVYANGKWQADRTSAILVAANDSSQAAKDAADYVADGTDDQVQINDALEDADPAGTGRKLGKVYLFAGTYTTHRTANSDATILIPNNTTLAGAGRGTLVRFGDIDATDYLIQNADISTGTGVVVRDMMIDGQKTLNTVGTQHGIYFANMGDGGGASAQRGGVIENIQAVSFSGTGIVLSSSNNNVIHANTIESSYGGVLLDASLYNTISGNSAHNSTYAGIQLQSSSSSNNIADNQIHTSANAGIRIQSTSAYNTVTGNQISGSTSYGMYISTIGNTVSSNEITGSSYGMVLPVGSGGNTMVANNIRNTTVDGIAVQNSSGNTISDNTIQNSTDEGLVLDAESHNNVLTGNVIDTTGGSGIQITGISGDEPTNNTVSGNSILNSGGSTTNYGIELVYAHKNTLANNRITDTSCTNNCYAISINANSTTNYISNNAFDSTSGTPIINDAGTGTIYSNQIDDAGVMMNRSSGGFEVQTTAGASLLNVNSSASTVSIDGVTDIQVNSASAFIVQNTSNDALFTVDTTNNQIVLGDVSGAPTLLVLGDKTTAGDPTGTDGAMYYNSALESFRCYQNGGWQNCVSPSYEALDIQDDFMSGMEASTALESTNSAGELGWLCMNQSGTDACQINWNDEDAGHPGIVYVGSMTTTTGNAGRMNLRPIDTGDFDRMTFIVKTSTSSYHSNSYYQIGLIEDVTAISDSTPNSGAFFRYTGGNWTAVTRLSNTETTTDTGVSNSTYTWYRLEIVRNSSNNFEFYINGTLEATHSTNKPTGLQLPAVRVQNAGSKYSEIHVDYFSMRSRVLSR